MQIGGLQKTSLIDFPETISCVIFLTGCNFNCPYCHNPQLVTGLPDAAAPNLDDVLSLLQSRRAFLEGVVISGGEPTLQPDLQALCEKLKELEYSVKLDTNGSRPDVIRDLMAADLVDYIAMDIKTALSHYDSFTDDRCVPDCILESIHIIMEKAPAYEFRTTCVKPLVSMEAVEEICRLIRGADLYVLQQFRNENILCPEFFQGMEPSFTMDELEALQSIAAGLHVKKCVIR
jgi:pyruvate formate lyase activating enzyme